MRKKKSVICCALVIALAAAATGCSDNMQTDEQIVIPKDEGSGQEQDMHTGEEQTGQEQSQDEDSGEKGAIAEQVQAPERFTAEMSGEHVHVKADAEVIVPNAEGFKSYKVTSREFEQADYDTVNRVLLCGASLWERDMEAMESSHGLTENEINAKIEEIKEIQNGADGSTIYEEEAKGRSYDEAIASWEKLLDGAPKEPILTEVPAQVVYSENEEQSQQNRDIALSGFATVNEKDYRVYLYVSPRSVGTFAAFRIEREDKQFSEAALAEKEKQKAGFSEEAIVEQAKEQVEAMGFTDFQAVGEEYCASLNRTSAGAATGIDDVGYTVHFARTLDGIPVNYTFARGEGIDESDSFWSYERMDLSYDENGLIKFEWDNPYQVEKISDEYLFLLPFSEIQTVFEEMMIKKYEDAVEQLKGVDEFQANYEINEVRLGYMRIREAGNVTEGTMVPVWDFYGTKTFQYDDGEFYVENFAYDSLITINALDGTIIDRDFGY